MNLETPFPFQYVGARWLAQQSQALLADDMGLGKSCQAVVASDMVGADNIIVVCPASVRVNWSREFTRFSPMDRPCTVVETKKDPIPTEGVVIISYDLLYDRAHELKRKMWDLLILDEAHYIKERTSKRTKAVYGHGSSRPGLAAHAKRVWRLTGTPSPNNASELYTHLRSAGIVNDPYWDFVFRYCSGFESSYGYKITGHKNVPELKGLLAQFMLRRTKEEVMPELPSLRFAHVTVAKSKVELDPTFYDQIRIIGADSFIENLRVGETTLRMALESVQHSKSPNEDRTGLLSSMAESYTSLRRYIGMAKLPACLDIIEEELATNQIQKIVLFGVHQCVIEGARERLRKFKPVTLYGGTPPTKRQHNIDKFQNDKTCRVFIGNIQAAGTGITLTAANELAFLEQSWVPAENAQALMRVHRIGQTRPVRARVFHLANSIDEVVQTTLVRKTRELIRVYA